MTVCWFDPHERAIIKSQTEFARYYLGNNRSLIESTLPLATAMQRDGSHNIACQCFVILDQGATDDRAQTRADVRVDLQEEDAGFNGAGINPTRARRVEWKR